MGWWFPLARWARIIDIGNFALGICRSPLSFDELRCLLMRHMFHTYVSFGGCNSSWHARRFFQRKSIESASSTEKLMFYDSLDTRK